MRQINRRKWPYLLCTYIWGCYKTMKLFIYFFSTWQSSLLNSSSPLFLQIWLLEFSRSTVLSPVKRAKLISSFHMCKGHEGLFALAAGFQMQQKGVFAWLSKGYRVRRTSQLSHLDIDHLAQAYAAYYIIYVVFPLIKEVRNQLHFLSLLYQLPCFESMKCRTKHAIFYLSKTVHYESD